MSNFLNKILQKSERPIEIIEVTHPVLLQLWVELLSRSQSRQLRDPYWLADIFIFVKSLRPIKRVALGITLRAILKSWISHNK